MFSRKNDLSSLKLGDFGLAKITDYKDTAKCGTLIYMTPEQMANKGYTKSIDVWATGFILFILCSGGMHPILTRKMDHAAYTIAFNNLDTWDFPEDFPLLARNLFLKMCKSEYRKRLGTLKILTHPWITRILKSNIPLTIIECFMKEDYIKLFRNVITFII